MILLADGERFRILWTGSGWAPESSRPISQRRSMQWRKVLNLFQTVPQGVPIQCDRLKSVHIRQHIQSCPGRQLVHLCRAGQVQCPARPPLHLPLDGKWHPPTNFSKTYYLQSLSHGLSHLSPLIGLDIFCLSMFFRGRMCLGKKKLCVYTFWADRYNRKIFRSKEMRWKKGFFYMGAP